MKLTSKLKKEINNMTYQDMLSKWRFAPIGDKLFSGESGEYFIERMNYLKNRPGGQEEHVKASKKIGW